MHFSLDFCPPSSSGAASKGSIIHTYNRPKAHLALCLQTGAEICYRNILLDLPQLENDHGGGGYIWQEVASTAKGRHCSLSDITRGWVGGKQKEQSMDFPHSWGSLATLRNCLKSNVSIFYDYMTVWHSIINKIFRIFASRFFLAGL